MTTIELVSIIRKRGQPTHYILMVDDEPITIQYKVPKTVQTKRCIPTYAYLPLQEAIDLHNAELDTYTPS